MWIFQMTQMIFVRAMSNLWVDNMYWIVAFKIHVFDASLLKKHQIEVILTFGNNFYHEYFLQYFEGCPRVSSFHLNNLDNKISNEL